MQYADYAQWQRDRLESGAFDRDLSYWREALAGAPPALELPTDKPRPPARTGRGSRFSISLPAETAAAVRRLALASSATPFMVLLAAFQLLLAKHAGQSEVVVGSPVAGRLRPELEGLIGLFVNTLALRADISDDPTFSSLVARVREACLSAYGHQEAPFERLVERLSPDRELSRTPVFQAMFIMQNAPGGVPHAEGVSFEGVEVEHGGAMFDLAVSLGESAGGGLEGWCEYSTDLFEEETARRLVERFSRVVSEAARRGGERVSLSRCWARPSAGWCSKNGTERSATTTAHGASTS